jgi:FkbM family methyltransferase
MNTTLKIKAMLVASPLEDVAAKLQWAWWCRRLWRHPELTELSLEGRHLAKVVAQLTGRTSNILDVGCHIGSFLSVAMKAAPGGKHVAIEAVPDKALRLKRKFPNVRVESIAVSDELGTATFDQNLTIPAHSRLRDGMKVGGTLRTYTVQTATIDSLNLGNFDLVKLDIEGAELAALKGASNLFSRCRPPFIFEYGVAEFGHQNPEEIYRYVTEQMGYDVFTFVDFLYRKGPLSLDEMRKCGIYPFRAFNFVAVPHGRTPYL